MALRTLIITVTLLLFLVAAAPALACFGPKLYWGVGAQPAEQALFALVSLYVQEKTGVESVRVDLETGQSPWTELTEERVDLVFVETPAEQGTTLLQVDGQPRLVSGARPLEDLQFTTVAPAIRKLHGLLTAADVDSLTAQVGSGEPPLAAARRFLMERRWI